jgi:hypothetical protein
MISCLDNAANGILLHVHVFFGTELVSLLLLSYIPIVSGQKWHINLATNQSSQNTENN